jgi:ATP-dependent Clp protease adaptor protein ClpS
MLGKLISKFKNYVNENERKHNERRESLIRLDEEWEKLKNEIPDEIRQIALICNKEEPFDLILINDDMTPMDYVVFILIKCFDMNNEISQRHMLEVHEKGMSVILKGIEKEKGEKLIKYLEGHANSRGFPLKWEIINT